MSNRTKAAAAEAAAGASPGAAEAAAPPVLLFRRGRGKAGGSTGLDLWVQRARWRGRRAKPLDGDLRSGTLARLHAAGEDAASSPPTEEMPDQKAWLLRELDAMAEDRVSRVVDFGGGDRVAQEFVRDLDLADFCRAVGVRLVSAYFLGPDAEDFRHVLQVARSGDLNAEHTLLVLNEGVVPQGQTVAGAFAPVVGDPDFRALLEGGARAVVMTRLACLAPLREAGLGFYGAAYPAEGAKVSATLRHMTKQWLERHEAAHAERGTDAWLP